MWGTLRMPKLEKLRTLAKRTAKIKIQLLLTIGSISISIKMENRVFICWQGTKILAVFVDLSSGFSILSETRKHLIRRPLKEKIKWEIKFYHKITQNIKVRLIYKSVLKNLVIYKSKGKSWITFRSYVISIFIFQLPALWQKHSSAKKKKKRSNQ